MPRFRVPIESNVLVIAGTVFLLVTSLFTWYLLLPLYFRDLGASDAQVGLGYSLITLGYTLMQFAGGLLTDRYGRKWLIVLPTFAFGPLYALAGAAQSWPVLFVALFLINSLSAIQSPAFTSLLAESVPEDRRGGAFGAFEFAISLAITVGPGLGALLLPLVGLRPLMYATAVISFIGALLRVVGLRETNHHPSPITLGHLKDFRQGQVRWFLVAACLFVTIYTLTLWGPFTSLHAEDALGLDKPQINGLFAMGGFASMVASLLGGRLADRYGGRNVLAIACLAHVGTMAAWAVAGASPVGLALFAASNASLQMGVVSYSTLLTQIATGQSRGTLIGLFGTITGLIATLAPTVGTYLRVRFGSAAPFWAALGFGLVASLLLRKVRAPRRALLAPRRIYSIGHSTRSLDEMVQLLAAYGIETLVDVRRFPRSRKNPQFNREALEEALPERGIEYRWLGDALGGFRDGGYEGYLATEEFRRGLAELEAIAAGKQTTFMCAEKLFFRCHRRFIAAALVERGWQVWHIIEAGREPYEHKSPPGDRMPVPPPGSPAGTLRM